MARTVNQLESKIMDAYLKTIIDKVKTKSWKTTLVGWILVCSGIFSVLYKSTNWVDASPLIIIGVGFIFTKDSEPDKK